ncbi:hypothetical protein MAC_04971 [Metarhizium acridum CQMa 102]|uniref:Uncharacterized protein n=1 Tax=Metarhizium acridum (strain CQMa 102) TaxID=655827 RepID=E9E523_METAQ|nr:uncharacterized protein MAC_04971 [Metarhizium acridum CQMa 102]EFY89040.1 hypothetical protein MAC_04971 [Metarhizium acridum CQMa 102]
MLIGFRLLERIAESAVLTIRGGTVADLFIRQERGKGLAAWAIRPLLRPVIGPVIGSFFPAQSPASTWSYSAKQPQTSFSATSPNAGAKKQATNLYSRRWTPTSSPLGLPARHRASVATLAAIIYGYLYLLFTPLNSVFEDEYHFASRKVGLTYLGLGGGMILGLFVFGAISDRMIKSKAAQNDGIIKPEYRLPPMIVRGIAIPAGLLVCGWTAEYHVFWLVPIMTTAFVGFAAMAMIPVPFVLIKYGERIWTSPRCRVNL